jgi:hypothetical protein
VPSEIGVLSRFPKDGDGFTAYLPDGLCCTVIGATQLLWMMSAEEGLGLALISGGAAERGSAGEMNSKVGDGDTEGSEDAAEFVPLDGEVTEKFVASKALELLANNLAAAGDGVEMAVGDGVFLKELAYSCWAKDNADGIEFT